MGGGGGVGRKHKLVLARFFFSIGLLCTTIFFFWIFSVREFYFGICPTPPQISNGPSLRHPWSNITRFLVRLPEIKIK